MPGSGEAGAADYFRRFFTPTLLGNVIGGPTPVAALNHGQVASKVQS
ncbi:hypothetical protein [Roseomonas sp. KE2513]|nr:hypothetical protein [Roseomonas sp. KE2513]